MKCINCKWFIFLMSIIFSLPNVHAQIPNSSFENWTNLLPNNWETNSCPPCVPPIDMYIVKSDSVNYTHLNYSALLLGNGVMKPYVRTTFPITQKPDSLKFDYRLTFAPCVNDAGFPEKDSVSVLVEILYNGVVMNQGYWFSNQPSLNFTTKSIALSQNNSMFDSCRITIYGGSNYSGCGFVQASTKFNIDKLEFVYGVGGNCIDSNLICDTCFCPFIWDPVCGCNGVTYGNSCEATINGVTSWTQGECGLQTYCDASFSFIKAVDSVTFYNNSQPGIGCNITSLDWDFGDGTYGTGPQPFHEYAADGNYWVCLILTANCNGQMCSDTFCRNVYITHGCIDTSLICPPGSLCCDAPLLDPVCGCDGNEYMNACVATYFGGVTSFLPDSVCGIESPDCTSWFVFNQLQDSIWFTQQATADFPCEILSYSWDFGDNSNSSLPYPFHFYSQEGYYTVCLTINSNCGMQECFDTHCDTIHVTHDCIDSFNLCFTCPCPDQFIPVCGCNGVTYSTACDAYYYAGVTEWTDGICPNSISEQATFNLKWGVKNGELTVSNLGDEKLKLQLNNLIGQSFGEMDLVSKVEEKWTSELSNGIYILTIENEIGKRKSFKVVIY